MTIAIGVIEKTAGVVAVLLCSGCAVVAVADAAVTVVSTVLTTAVKAAGAVVNAVIPDSRKSL
jgi:hypothetical protein